MSNSSPFGFPIAPGQGTPKFPQPTAPGFNLAFGTARAAEAAAPAAFAQKPEGPLVQPGTGIVPQPSPVSGPPLQVLFDNVTQADLERFETARRAMFQEGIS